MYHHVEIKKHTHTSKPSSIRQSYPLILCVRDSGRDRQGHCAAGAVRWDNADSYSWWVGGSGGSRMASRTCGGPDSARTVGGNACRWHFHLGGLQVVGFISHGGSEVLETVFEHSKGLETMCLSQESMLTRDEAVSALFLEFFVCFFYAGTRASEGTFISRL